MVMSGKFGSGGGGGWHKVRTRVVKSNLLDANAVAAMLVRNAFATARLK